jgi:hypothetical protein
MSLVEELKQRFAVSVVAPWGNCLVIPKKAFVADWEEQLNDQGCGCVFTNMGSEQVVLVRLGKVPKESGGERVVFEPEPKAPISPTASTAAIVKPDVAEKVANLQDPARRWTDADDELLVQLWKKEPKLIVAKITESFPKRSLHGVQMELSRLQKAGKIASRFKHRAAHGHNTHMGSGWSDQDYGRLIGLWNAGKSLDEIAKEFPSRTFPAVKQTLKRLRRAGKINPRGRGRPLGRQKEIQTKHDVAQIPAPSRSPGVSDETKPAEPRMGSGPGPMLVSVDQLKEAVAEADLAGYSRGRADAECDAKSERPSPKEGSLPFTVTINVDVRVDCCNPASVEAFRKLLKEELTA